ncbi:hypothetical protein BJG01_12985 [Vibrio splendidus]|nr:hypothetical protein BCT36_00730 [Vibrio splendidus]RIH73789.1 hypothetical protein BJG01_12985 [Vibrio splendidus]
MKTYKEENGLDHLFFSITDTKNKEANLLWVDESDYQVIKSAFNAEPTSDMLTLRCDFSQASDWPCSSKGNESL